jgi:hypothetical protein
MCGDAFFCCHRSYCKAVHLHSLRFSNACIAKQYIHLEKHHRMTAFKNETKNVFFISTKFRFPIDFQELNCSQKIVLDK